MTEVFPQYYPRFRCRAAACRHTCCRGWEIDIDEETREIYRAVGGALGEKLRRSIVDGDETASFRLTADERCPFLLDSGLCQLILELGEENLCQICTDHPRFRSFFSDRTEVGVGLCCEAAAALVLTQAEPMRLCTQGAEALEPEEEAFLAARETLLAIAQERARPLDERMDELLAQTGAALPERSGAAWFEVYIKLERLEPEWEICLAALQNAPALAVPPALALPAEQLLCYFLYRHLAGALDDGCFAARTAFAVLSTRIVATLWQYGGAQPTEVLHAPAAEAGCVSDLEAQNVPDGEPFDTASRKAERVSDLEALSAVGLETFCDLARRYSAEIEYSDENTAALLALLTPAEI